MTYEEALRRVNAEVNYDPKDSSSRGLIPARILEVHHNKKKVLIVTAGTPQRDHTRWVPIDKVRKWKSRDEAAGIVDPSKSTPLAVVMAAESTADHIQNVEHSFTDRMVETLHKHGSEMATRFVETVIPSVSKPAIRNPGWCEWCDTSGHDPDSMDENGACRKCHEILMSGSRLEAVQDANAAETDGELMTATSPDLPVTTGEKDEPVRPLQFIRWVVLDLTNRRCYDPATRQFMPLDNVGGYVNSSNAHRSSGQLYRHTKNPFIFVVTRSQAEHLLTTPLPTVAVDAKPPVLAMETFEQVLQSVKHANELVVSTKAAYDKAVAEARRVGEVAAGYRKQLEEQLKQLGV